MFIRRGLYRRLARRPGWLSSQTSGPIVCLESLGCFRPLLTSKSIPFYGAPRPTTASGTEASLLHRLALTVQSATTAFADPTRADAVATLGELTGHVALTRMCDLMMSDPVGKRILKERPIVSKATLPIDVDELTKSATTATSDVKDSTQVTFGEAYVAFLRHHGFDPDERSQVAHVENPELAYIMLRYRQCHDYWHVLTGLPPTVLGELGLKWLELLQFGLPVAALSATLGSLRLSSREREVLTGVYLPWAVRMSEQSTFLLNVYYEEEFDTSLHELRDRLRVEQAPSVRI